MGFMTRKEIERSITDTWLEACKKNGMSIKEGKKYLPMIIKGIAGTPVK